MIPNILGHGRCHQWNEGVVLQSMSDSKCVDRNEVWVLRRAVSVKSVSFHKQTSEEQQLVRRDPSISDEAVGPVASQCLDSR